ncbi:DUF2066 domain-containing protein [Marinimicrobium locisalis]|uniref:DUF2066 domain-containing protein n=1 Tax=Marinimicrobium locisalis TaxID=546022 RepID=UPI003221CD0F
MATATACVRSLGVILVGLAMATVVRADQVVDLYTAEVLVTSQSEAERQRAAREGLADLVVRVTGDTQAREHPQVQEALTRAEGFITEFNYGSTRETVEVGGEARPASRLVMRFSSVEVERLLRSANLSLWPANRPGVLVWMVTREGGDLSRVSDSERREQLRARARVRGLPLVVPLNDLEDRLALQARQLWELDEEAIRKASQRYDAEAILVGRYSETTGGQWRSDWQLYHNLGNPTFYVRADSVEGVLSQAIDETANHFASLYAIVPREEGPGTVVMQVGGVDGFGEYKAVERYLEDLAMVRRAGLITLRPGVLTLRLMVEGDRSQLLGMLERDGQLVPAMQSGRISLSGNRFEPEGTLANPLSYTWQ